MQSVPNDGYQYVYLDYQADDVDIDWNYKIAGTVRVENPLEGSTEVTYTQSETETTTWSVAGEISGTTEIGNDFIGSVEATASASAGRDRTFYSGNSYGLKKDITGQTVAYLTNYAVGGNTNGAIRYKKYSPSGASYLGIYKDYQGGTAVMETFDNVEITSTSPF